MLPLELFFFKIPKAFRKTSDQNFGRKSSRLRLLRYEAKSAALLVTFLKILRSSVLASYDVSKTPIIAIWVHQIFDQNSLEILERPTLSF